jgi:phage-related minor tail protein
MAERIKGITVEIGGDTVGLDKALKGVNKTSRSLQSELKDVQRLLKFDPNNAELMAQKQNLLNDQIENTNKKLKQLKEAEAQVQAQFEKGDIKEEQYRAFQRELQDTQQFLRHTENALADLKDEQDEVGNHTKQLNQLFQSQNKTLEDYADVLGNRLVRSIQNGTASSRDLQKAFRLVGKDALGASVDVDEIRQALNKLDSGEASIKEIRKELQKLSSDAGEAEGAIDKLGNKLGGLEGVIGGLGAGIGLDAILGKSLDMADLKAVIDVSMNLPDESKQAVYDSIKTVEAYGIDAQESLSGVRKQFQLNGDVSDEENAKIVKYAGVIQKAYQDIDFNELIQETNEMTKGLNMSQEEALGMTKTLLDLGFPPEQLDIISEYGSQLSRAGYTAEEIQGVFASGIETKSWNIDNLMDGLKEGRILLAEFGAEVPKAVADSLAGTDISVQQVQNWGKAIAEGGEQGKQAMFDVALALSQVEDETKRNELGTKLFGTMWEEQGKNITDTIIGAKDNQVALTEGTNNLAEATKKIDASPQVALNTALTEMNTALAPLFTMVAEFVTVIANWASQNPVLAGTIVAIVTVLGILIGIALAVTSAFALASASGITLAGVMAVLTSPITLVIAIIVALIAIGVALYKNWGTIQEKGRALNKTVSEAFSNMRKAVSEKMQEIWTKIKEIWGKVQAFFEGIDLKQIGKDIIAGLISGITAKATELYRKATEIASNISKKIKKALDSKSPSRVTMKIGKDVGEGLAIGIDRSKGIVGKSATGLASEVVTSVGSFAGKVGNTANQLAEQVIKTFEAFLPDAGDDILNKYFNAIRDDGDYMNDWLTHLPKEMNSALKGIGKLLAPELEGQALTGNPNADFAYQYDKYRAPLTVNLHSPKALDVREANKVFNRTVNKMSLMW